MVVAVVAVVADEEDVEEDVEEVQKQRAQPWRSAKREKSSNVGGCIRFISS